MPATIARVSEGEGAKPRRRRGRRRGRRAGTPQDQPEHRGTAPQAGNAAPPHAGQSPSGSQSGQSSRPELVEPVCQASLIRQRFPAGGTPGLLLFSNPADPKARVKLTVRASNDDGMSCPGHLLLHEGPSAYSCLVAIDAERAGCLYERGEKGPYEKIVFARFTASAVLLRTWVLRNSL